MTTEDNFDVLFPEPKLQHTFENMDEFHKWIASSSVLHTQSGGVNVFYTFHNFYADISQGCPCNKRARVDQSTRAYLDLKNLNEEVQQILKQGLHAKKVIFKHAGQPFCEF